MDSASPGSTFEPDIDRAALGTLVHRFRRQHALRLRRTGGRLLGRQRRVLEALPMLYHRNHPALPGYVGPDVPCGISGFRPDEEHLTALKRVARSYQEPRPAPAQTDLQAIFIMGSGGTIGQGTGSDIDLWVCCDALLHSALWPKVRMIDQWAAELGLELHTFLVDPDVLRIRRRLPGTRTPSLVLDEFYRSGALMADRYPLWWLIDTDDPDAYQAMARRLILRRFVSPEAVVDFGPVPAFPADELAQAAITELDRALATPHKSLLKLKLMEAYARAPELGTVSATYKARLHAGETDPLRLDPYLLLYDHVQRYLERGGGEDELDFVRSLLIGKAAENARVPHLASAATQDQSALLQRFIGWGYSADDVARFRSLDGWSMRERLIEHGRIMQALERGLELVESLVARAAAEAEPPDTLLGPGDGHQLHWLNETRLRHLRFAMARMRDVDTTIPTLHPALIGRRQLLPLTLEHTGDAWLAREDQRPVLQRRRLVEMAVWAELNGATLSPAHPDAELMRNLAQILQGFHGPTRASYVFVNAELAAGAAKLAAGAAEPAAAGDSLLRLRTDPLAHVGYQHLELRSIDVVSRADGHWRLDSSDNEHALLERLGQLLAEDPETVSWQVIGDQSRFVVAHRLEQLHSLASRILAAEDSMFVLPFGRGMVTVRRAAARLDIRHHDSLTALRHYAEECGCAAVGFDPANQRLKTMLRAG